jgi:hypothetical protein
MRLKKQSSSSSYRRSFYAISVHGLDKAMVLHLISYAFYMVVGISVALANDEFYNDSGQDR